MLRRNFAFWAIAIAFLMACSSHETFAQTSDVSDTQSAAKIVDRSDDGAGLTAKTETRATTPAPPSPATWTGFYVGGYLGGNWGRATANTSTVFSPTGY